MIFNTNIINIIKMDNLLLFTRSKDLCNNNIKDGIYNISINKLKSEESRLKLLFSNNVNIFTLYADFESLIYSILIELKSEKIFKVKAEVKNNRVYCNIYMKKLYYDKLKIAQMPMLYSFVKIFSKFSSNDDSQYKIKNIKLFENIKYKKLNCENQLKNSLYLYQNNNINWMKNIENRVSTNINYNFKYFINYRNFTTHNINIYYNDDYLMRSDMITDKINFKMKGGVLCDEVGLGKTLSFISLILENPLRELKDDESKASLVFCPPRLCKQWENEIKKFVKKKIKVASITSIVKFKKLTVDDFKNYDVIIISFNFITNKKYLEQNNFKFTNLKWNRIIVDEAHELFNKNNMKRNYLYKLNSKYKWLCTGTPLAHKVDGIEKMLQFLTDNKIKNLKKLKNDKINYLINYYFKQNTKKSVEKYLNIPNIIETTKLLTQSPIEKAIYEYAKDNKKRLIELCTHVLISEENINDDDVKIMSLDKIHKIMTDKLSKELKLLIVNDKNLDLEIKEKENEIKENIKEKDEFKKLYDENKIDDNKELLDNYRRKVTYNKKRLKTFIERKKILDNTIREKKRKFNIFNDLNNYIKDTVEEDCLICLEEINDIVISDCGHVYCLDCIKELWKLTHENYIKCPMCRFKLYKNSIKQIKKNIETEQDNNINKYGTKMAYLLTYLKHLFENDNNKVIVFSKYIKMLNLVSNVLKENNINFVNIKGNVYVKNKAIERFKTDKDTKVIMLSSESCSSGSNLTEASHIILLDTINADNIETVKAIEEQAIGRAVRLGQTKRVEVIRLIMKNTIEHDYYKKYYC